MQSKKVVVFTNGCFDILHVGHIHYLNEAKKLGNYLDGRTDEGPAGCPVKDSPLRSRDGNKRNRP